MTVEDPTTLSQAAPQLIRVSVESLLGVFDHTIDFPADWPFVIVFGPNGVGKTRFLELVRGAANLQRTELFRTPFQSLVFTFDDGTRLSFEKPATLDLEGIEDAAPSRAVHVTLRRASGESASFELSSGWGGEFENWLNVATPWVQMDDTMWRDSTDGELAHVSELYQRYEQRIPRAVRIRNRQERGQEHVSDEFGVIREFCATVPVHLIETQRLLTAGRVRERDPWDEGPPSPNYVATVTQHSHDLREQLSQTITKHSRLSQQLDRTFPKRIIETERDGDSEESIRSLFQSQNELRARLSTFSLIDAQDEVELPEGSLNKFEVNALAIYLDDTEQKLAVFSSLLEKLELFVNIMNSRLVRKTVSIDVTRGLAVRRADTGAEIPTESLSSGEQHEMVLVYDLLFRTEVHSIVLIDEPEISLHVAWQKEFLRDISRIARLSDLRFIVATHSPQIIDEWWSRTNELSAD